MTYGNAGDQLSSDDILVSLLPPADRERSPHQTHLPWVPVGGVYKLDQDRHCWQHGGKETWNQRVNLMECKGLIIVHVPVYVPSGKEDFFPLLLLQVTLTHSNIPYHSFAC